MLMEHRGLIYKARDMLFCRYFFAILKGILIYDNIYIHFIMLLGSI